jgi:hypothetical protein
VAGGESIGQRGWRLKTAKPAWQFWRLIAQQARHQTALGTLIAHRSGGVKRKAAAAKESAWRHGWRHGKSWRRKSKTMKAVSGGENGICGQLRKWRRKEIFDSAWRNEMTYVGSRHRRVSIAAEEGAKAAAGGMAGGGKLKPRREKRGAAMQQQIWRSSAARRRRRWPRKHRHLRRLASAACLGERLWRHHERAKRSLARASRSAVTAGGWAAVHRAGVKARICRRRTKRAAAKSGIGGSGGAARGRLNVAAAAQ